MIRQHKWRAERKARSSWWWSAEKTVVRAKIAKRYALLHEISMGIPYDKPTEVGALFCAYAGYTECIVSTRSIMYERACYARHVKPFATSERIAAGKDQLPKYLE